MCTENCTKCVPELFSLEKTKCVQLCPNLTIANLSNRTCGYDPNPKIQLKTIISQSVGLKKNLNIEVNTTSYLPVQYLWSLTLPSNETNTFLANVTKNLSTLLIKSTSLRPNTNYNLKVTVTTREGSAVL